MSDVPVSPESSPPKSALQWILEDWKTDSESKKETGVSQDTVQAQNAASQKLNDDSDDSDCVFIDEQISTLNFFPHTKCDGKKCREFKLTFKCRSNFRFPRPTTANRPSTVKDVKGDGNCFFRCISYTLHHLRGRE